MKQTFIVSEAVCLWRLVTYSVCKLYPVLARSLSILWLLLETCEIF